MTSLRKVEDLGTAPVMFSRRFRFQSELIGAPFVVDIALPPPYLTPSAPWPVLFITDGNLAFATTANAAAILPIEPGGPCPVCVVGIGYDLAGHGEGGEQFVLRNRDLTPVRNEDWELRMRAAPPPFHFGEELQTGGGETFLDFIQQELTPWLAANFPVNPDDCTLAGSSIGATLVLHALFTRPGAFARHLAISPSLWWANRHIMACEERYAKAHDDLDTQLYLCIGAAEEAQAPDARMVSEFEIFTRQLEARNYSSLSLQHEILPDQTHVSVFTPAISNGIRRLFGANFL